MLSLGNYEKANEALDKLILACHKENLHGKTRMKKLCLAMREYDDLTLTIAVAEGINIEVNRELQESASLLAGMAIIVTFI